MVFQVTVIGASAISESQSPTQQFSIPTELTRWLNKHTQHSDLKQVCTTYRCSKGVLWINHLANKHTDHILITVLFRAGRPTYEGITLTTLKRHLKHGDQNILQRLRRRRHKWIRTELITFLLLCCSGGWEAHLWGDHPPHAQMTLETRGSEHIAGPENKKA